LVPCQKLPTLDVVLLPPPTKPRASKTSSNAEPRTSSMLRSVSVPCETDPAVPCARLTVTLSDALR